MDVRCMDYVKGCGVHGLCEGMSGAWTMGRDVGCMDYVKGCRVHGLCEGMWGAWTM